MSVMCPLCGCVVLRCQAFWHGLCSCGLLPVAHKHLLAAAVVLCVPTHSSSLLEMYQCCVFATGTSHQASSCGLCDSSCVSNCMVLWCKCTRPARPFAWCVILGSSCFAPCFSRPSLRVTLVSHPQHVCETAVMACCTTCSLCMLPSPPEPPLLAITGDMAPAVVAGTLAL